MMKFIKYSLIGCGTLFVIACIGIFLLIGYAIGGEETGVPISIEYHNEQDLYKISNVKFPEVIAVDSSYYVSFSLLADTVKFVLNDKSKYSDLLSEIDQVSKTDSMYWKEKETYYEYFIIPEVPIDRPNGSGWKRLPSGEMDYDGEFIRLEIPKSITADTIILTYGWAR